METSSYLQASLRLRHCIYSFLDPHHIVIMSKYRILCLHGYRQNAIKLRGRIAALRRAFKSSVEFGSTCVTKLCLDAPLSVPYESTVEEDATTDTTGENVNQLKWFSYIQDEDSGQSLLEQVNESLMYIANFVEKEGPFDGVFGFSQGGTMASLILQKQVSGLEPSFAFCFAIFVSAGACTDPKYVSGVKVDVPSLHIIGETDTVVKNESSLALTDLFINAKVLMHSGGHYIVTNKESKDVFRAFFKKLHDDGLKK